jgi:hypothetical protein
MSVSDFVLVLMLLGVTALLTWVFEYCEDDDDDRHTW